MRSWREIRELNILGIIWKVRKSPTLKAINKSQKSWGCISPTDRKIILYSKIPTERDYRLALIHEIIHAVCSHLKPFFDILSTALLVQDGIGWAEAVEAFVDLISKYLFQVLQDNDLLT